MFSKDGIVRTAVFFIDDDGNYVFAGYPSVDEMLLFQLKENKTEEGTIYFYTDEQSIKNIGKIITKVVSDDTQEDFYLCTYKYKVIKA